jgi:hypothetical protein
MTIWRAILFAFASALVAATASADLMPRTYFVPVVARNVGAAGVSGFRTSVGVFNYAGAAQQVRIFGLDPAGNPVWKRWEWTSPARQRHYLLTRALPLPPIAPRGRSEENHDSEGRTASSRSDRGPAA